MVLWLQVTGGFFITPETENMMEPAWESIQGGESSSPRELICVFYSFFPVIDF